jgi:hypothetical protein
MLTEAVGELVEPTGMTVFLVPSTSSGTAYKVNAVALLTTLVSYVFSSTSGSLRIYVPAAKVAAYKALSGWSEYASKIEASSE